MEQGIAAIFVGVGPGAACTTREVLGIGVPQVTAIADVAAARRRPTSSAPAATCPWWPTAACAAAASWPRPSPPGADAVMLGSPLARAAEAPGDGTNWGMACALADAAARHPHPGWDSRASLERILLRPVAGHRWQREPRGRAAPVHGGAWAPRTSGPCSRSRWSSRRPSPRRASPGSESCRAGEAIRHEHRRLPESAASSGLSPVHPLPRLSAALAGVNTWAKREDCNSGIAPTAATGAQARVPRGRCAGAGR